VSLKLIGDLLNVSFPACAVVLLIVNACGIKVGL
jgi:hypothetical protein